MNTEHKNLDGIINHNPSFEMSKPSLSRPVLASIPTPSAPKVQFEFNGTHLFGELYGIPAHLLDNQIFLSRILMEAIPKGNATICGIQTKKFEPSGVTVLALLSESHASIHTYPEQGALFLDVFTCGNCVPRKIFEHILCELQNSHFNVKEINRGNRKELDLK